MKSKHRLSSLCISNTIIGALNLPPSFNILKLYYIKCSHLMNTNEGEVPESS